MDRGHSFSKIDAIFTFRLTDATGPAFIGTLSRREFQIALVSQGPIPVTLIVHQAAIYLGDVHPLATGINTGAASPAIMWRYAPAVSV